jgi:hypothetical protein
VVLGKKENEMDEDLLSPQMGRLIDQAKAAALKIDPAVSGAEGVALLAGDGSVYSGAVDTALAAARQAGVAEILAAAVAVAADQDGTNFPSRGCRRSLAAIDPELPVVVKERGRWVLRLLSHLPSTE